VGMGCVVHIPTLLEEIKVLRDNNINPDGRLYLSDRAHLVFEYHKIIDGLQEESKGENKVGTTKRGIGPAYADKMMRIGIRAHELLDFEKFEQKIKQNVAILQQTYNFDYDVEKEIETYKGYMEQLEPMIIDAHAFLHKAIKDNKKVLFEGANATLLDIDHGTYPFVTSSNPSVGGMSTGTGVAPSYFTSTIGIMKAYMSRVGAGPFPTEQDNDLGNQIREKGGEYGSTTGRPRRCGWFDAVCSKYSAEINNFSSINLTKLDVLDGLETVKIAVAYHYQGKKLESFPASLDILQNVEVEYLEMPGWKEDSSGARKISDLPENARKYVEKIEELLETPIDFVGVGQKRKQMAVK